MVFIQMNARLSLMDSSIVSFKYGDGQMAPSILKLSLTTSILSVSNKTDTILSLTMFAATVSQASYET
jgi:hypothetical protein